MFGCVYRFFKSCIRPNIYQSSRLVTYKSIINSYNTNIVINIYIHDFWPLTDGINKAHETQNFVKNLAICAGLLVLASREKFVKLGQGR